jgi:hypothetical protein
VLFLSELAIARGLLRVGARGLDEIEDRLVATLRFRKRSARDHHTQTAMAISLMIERKLDFSSNVERPLGEKADSFGGPLHLFLNELE